MEQNFETQKNCNLCNIPFRSKRNSLRQGKAQVFCSNCSMVIKSKNGKAIKNIIDERIQQAIKIRNNQLIEILRDGIGFLEKQPSVSETIPIKITDWYKKQKPIILPSGTYHKYLNALTKHEDEIISQTAMDILELIKTTKGKDEKDRFENACVEYYSSKPKSDKDKKRLISKIARMEL